MEKSIQCVSGQVTQELGFSIERIPSQRILIHHKKKSIWQCLKHFGHHLRGESWLSRGSIPSPQAAYNIQKFLES